MASCDEYEDLPDSQVSLQLSQGTLNVIMEAASSQKDILETIFISEEEEASEDINMDGPSSITIQRSIYTPSSANMNPAPPCSQQFSPYPPPPLHHVGQDSAISSANTTPTQVTPPSNSPGISDGSSSSYHHHSHMPSLSFMRSNLPSNIPVSGEYNFRLLLQDDENKPSKTATMTYSDLTKRVYIRRDTTVALTFSFSKIPRHSVIRGMAIHKTPELVGDVLQCCPKHIEEQKKKGHQHPRHFICGATNTEAVYCEDPLSGRLSITIPVSSLQQKSDDSVQAFFVFPCFTSELHKGHGQLAQLIFTLEIGGHVVGRAVVDARVCASTGRDRENDESKVSSSISPDASNELSRRSRKRTASAVTQNLECTVPAKINCTGLSRQKQNYTIETFPELFPFIDVCVKMMERVHKLQVQVSEGSNPVLTTTSSTSSSDTLMEQSTDVSLPEITSIDNWLQHLNLTQYGPTLERHGICHPSQAISLSDDQLRSLGIKNPLHREQILRGLELIPIANPTKQQHHEERSSQSTQPYRPQLLSQDSSVSSASSITQQTVEVLRIQMRKTFSSSSNSSTDNNY